MNFRDIKKFTVSGSWECNFGLGGILPAIKDFEKEYGLELNPDFQRGRVWTEEQQIAFVEFFLRGGKLNAVFLNSPHWNRQDSEYQDMVCVDGLQRLTALMRFENNEIPAFGVLFKDFEGRPRASQATLRININDLQTKKEVLQWYIELNEGGTPHTKEEINRVKEMIK
jgi:uncharacterized protein with ParB-like and HNH nuclease domain